MARLRRNERLAVGYCRVSTQEQGDKGNGLDAQYGAVRDYCERQGLRLVGVAGDVVSGSTALEERPGGAALLALLDVHRAGSVVTVGLDRLSRDQLAGGGRLKAWRDAGVKVHTRGGIVDQHSATGILSTTVQGAVAEWYRNIVRERTRDALAHKRAQGQSVGRPPAGFRSVRDAVDERVTRLAPIPGHPAHAVRARAHALRASGLSLAAVAERLNAEGHATSRGGSRFFDSTVRAMLRAPVVEAAHVPA